jgi:hypothetical protein
VITVGAVSGITWVVAAAAGVAAGLLAGIFLPPRAPAISFVGLGGFFLGALGGTAIGANVAARLYRDAETSPRKTVVVGAMVGVTLATGVIVVSLSEARVGAWVLTAASWPVAGPAMVLAGLLAPGLGAVTARSVSRRRT